MKLKMMEIKQNFDRRVLNSKIGKIKYTKFSEGIVGFFCPRCFSPIYCKQSINTSIITNFDAVYWRMNYSINCPYCNHTFRWDDDPLDPNITKSIALLNSKGYTTLFSCEGHDEYGEAYVYFKHPDQRHVAKYIPVPEPWKLRISTDRICRVEEYDVMCKLNYSKQFCIDCDSNTKLEDRIKSLYEWAMKLPICPTTRFYKKYIHLPLAATIIN